MSEPRKQPEFGSAGIDSKQIQSHLNIEKSRLHNELENFLSASSEDSFDVAKLDQLLNALDEIDPLPDIEAQSAGESLEQFHEKYAPVFASAEEKSAATKTASPVKSHSKHISVKVLSLAAIIVILIGSVTAQGFGRGIFDAIARWTSGTAGLDATPSATAKITKHPLAKGEETSFDSIEDALDAFGISALVIPSWLPEQFELVKIMAFNKDGGIKIQIDYEGLDGYLRILYSEIQNNDFSLLEKGIESMISYTSGNTRYYLTADIDLCKAVWQNGDLECQIDGTVTTQEMIQIVDSIH